MKKKKNRAPRCPQCRGVMARTEIAPLRYECLDCPELTPVQWLDSFLDAYPWVPAAYLSAQQSRKRNWPSWCYAPSSVGRYAIECVPLSQGFEIPIEHVLQHTGPITALMAWRATRSVYRFHPALLRELRRTPIDDVPCEVLKRLPVWCPYVECLLASDVAGFEVRGFFAHLDWLEGTTHDAPIMRVVIDSECLDDVSRSRLFAIPIALEAGLTVPEALRRGMALNVEAARAAVAAGHLPEDIEAMLDPKDDPTFPDSFIAMLQSALSVLLYLCADDAEVTPRDEPLPTLFRPGRVGPEPPTPLRDSLHLCGVRLGAALQLAREREANVVSDPTGRTKAGHIRRAHWHTYWLGSRDSVRTPVLRWLSPIAVNLDEAPEQTTLHVRSELPRDQHDDQPSNHSDK